jgi:hypothetical protein
LDLEFVATEEVVLTGSVGDVAAYEEFESFEDVCVSFELVHPDIPTIATIKIKTKIGANFFILFYPLLISD